MSMDGIFNIIAFIVGLGIGLFQLYVAQHQFEVQQREKMDEIRKILTEIQQRLAIMEEVNSQRSFDVQNKLISLVAGEQAVADFTEETLLKIQNIVSNELKKAGVEDSVQRTQALEKKIASVLEKSAASLVDSTAQDRGNLFTNREILIIGLLKKGISTEAIANTLGVKRELVVYTSSRIANKLGLNGTRNLREFLKTFEIINLPDSSENIPKKT